MEVSSEASAVLYEMSFEGQADKAKSQELFERWGVQSSELTNNLDFNIIIHQSCNIVNRKFEEIIEKESAEYSTIIVF